MSVPRVVTARVCVSPLVNRALPCTLGRQPALLHMGRTSVTPLPSTLCPSSSTSRLVALDATSCMLKRTSTFLSFSRSLTQITLSDLSHWAVTGQLANLPIQALDHPQPHITASHGMKMTTVNDLGCVAHAQHRSCIWIFFVFGQIETYWSYMALNNL